MAKTSPLRLQIDLPSPLREVDDAELITGLAGGMDHALDELIARYGDRLCSYLLRIVRDGAIVREPGDAPRGELLAVRVASAEIEARVETVRPASSEKTF